MKRYGTPGLFLVFVDNFQGNCFCFWIDVFDEQGDPVGFVQEIPVEVCGCGDVVKEFYTERFAGEGGWRIAIVLIGCDAVADAWNGGFVVEKMSSCIVAVESNGFQDGEFVDVLGIIQVYDARDTWGVDGRVRFEGACAECTFECIPILQIVEYGVGLVAVGEDVGVVVNFDRVVDDERGVLQFGFVEGFGFYGASLGDKGTVAAAFAAAHDPVNLNDVLFVWCLTEDDASTGVGGIF